MPHPHPWLVALPVRVVSAVLSRAFFQPDEYYQNLEPAYSLVFGPHAGAYSTWEWSLTPDSDPTWSHGGSGGIRSPLGVAASAAVYWVLKRAQCDDGQWMVLAPRLAQACIAASMDVAFVRLASRILGPAYTNAALLTTLTSFFHFFAASRTLTNSTETALTAWALRYWPFDADVNNSEASLACAMAVAALACVVRPSNAVVWAWLGGHLFVRSSARARWEIVRVTAVIGLLTSLFSFALDTLFYSTPTFTPLRFLSTNVLRSISIFYGSNSPHFYLTQGLPILLLTQLPFFIDGLSSRRWQGVRNVRALEALRATLVGTLATYSLLSHKEWRFIHPLLPVMHLFVVLSLVSRFAFSPSTSSTPPSSPTTRLARHLRVRASHATILLLSLLPATYLTHFHGSGQTRVSSYLRSLPLPLLEKTSVGWLMPCHSAAWGAHLHTREWGRELRELERDGKGKKGERGKGERGRMWMVTCEPPLEAQDSSTYQDETDLFYASPCEFLSTRFPSHVDPSFPSFTPSSDLEGAYTWPRRLVLFSSLLSQPCPHSSPVPSTVEGLLIEKGYEREWSAWNTLGGWHEDSRRRGRVEVWSWSGVGSGEEEVRER
ncbi:dol-P-Man alpha-mannosyltransferase, glycosyltransferase family 22 protein [Rhodotorula toruloides]|uniref:Mannosyltransferase n=1 Tax=Rhodotorula toruloides TaxID=5286 RepID=A0A511KR83_RHOTO|nr:dol-P-Man alpha-mannosyltransferase, glycosyltransferase family 22 protein [Rhodotorula toruloides]